MQKVEDVIQTINRGPWQQYRISMSQHVSAAISKEGV